MRFDTTRTLPSSLGGSKRMNRWSAALRPPFEAQRLRRPPSRKPHHDASHEFAAPREPCVSDVEQHREFPFGPHDGDPTPRFVLDLHTRLCRPT